MKKAFKALSETKRLDIFLIINDIPDICLCNLEVCFSLSISTLSRHLKELELANLISSYKEGKWKYYTISKYGELFITFINSTMTDSMKNKIAKKITLLNEDRQC